MGLSDIVVYAGFHRDVRDYVSVFDVGYILSDAVETVSNAAREMLAMGVPLISSSYSGLTVNVDHSVNGFLVEPGRTEPVVESMIRFMDMDTETMAAFRDHARNIAVERFDLNKKMDELGSPVPKPVKIVVMTEVIHIGWPQLALGLLFVLGAGAASMYYGLGLEKNLACCGGGAHFCPASHPRLRAAFPLRHRPDCSHPACVRLHDLFRSLDHSRPGQGKADSFSWCRFLSACCFRTALVSILVTGVVVGADPWWKPQYFIPLAGMVIGNSMNAIAIALDRLVSDLRARRAEVEMKLCLGADVSEASTEMVAGAMKAGMIPSINGMMAVGIVFIPGMMTGQILAGADPLEAIRYQIVVMLMIVGSTALGSMLVVRLVRRRCFGPGQQLLLRPQHTKG